MNRLLFISSLIFLSFLSKAQDITSGLWYNEEKTAKVQFYSVNNKISGKIVWLNDPTENGKPRTDINNPDVKKRQNPLMGLVFMKNFVKKGDKVWEDGTIYDPNNGKTYSCEMTLVNNELLNVRGYIGFSLIGRTSKFTRVN